MSSRLYVAKIGGGEIELTGFTGLKGSPMLDRSENLIEMGMRFANGEASQGQFKVLDPDAELPRLDGEFNLPPHKLVTWTEDASGDEIWLARARVASFDGGRANPGAIVDDQVEFDVIVDDGNVDLRGQAFTEPWVRPAETGHARLLALQAYTLNGASSTATKHRATCEITVSASHLAPATNTVTMPAKTYPPGTQPQDVVTECADTEGKVYGVVIHHTGGSHLCLLYIVENDHSTYTTAVKISDVLSEQDPTHATAPVLAPHWQMGKATIHDGQQLVSGIVSVRGGDTSVFVEHPDNVTDYDYWVESFGDSESETAAQQTAIANSLLQYRRITHVTHRVSVILAASQLHLLGSGMSIQIKAAAALGGQYLDTWQTRRIAECSFRPRADGRYWADLHLDRVVRRRPYRVGAKPIFDPPCSDFEPIASLGAAATDDGISYESQVVADQYVERVALTLSQSVAVGQSIVVITGHSHNADPETGVWDDAGNTYTKAADHRKAISGDQPRVQIWYTSLTTALSPGDKIYWEVGVGASLITALETDSKAISAYLFDGTLSAGAESGTASGFSSAPSVAVGAGGLLVAGLINKGGASSFPDTITNDADWTAFTQAASALTESFVQIAGGFRVNDAGGETWSGTIDQARDWAMVGATFSVADCEADTPPVGEESDDGSSPVPARKDHTHEALVIVRKNSTGSDFTRRRLNLIEGSGVTLTVADDSASNEVDVTIAASGGGGGTGSVAYAKTASSISFASTTWAALDTATDLTLGAAAGDLLEVEVNARTGVENNQLFMDVYTMVSGSPVNSVSQSAAALTGTSGSGHLSWEGINGQVSHPGGSVFYVVQAGDISGGQVTLRWYRKTSLSTPNKSVSGGARIHATNWS